MKAFALVAAGIFLMAWGADAAVPPPVHWTIKTFPVNGVKPGAKFNVTISGKLDAGWHLYALEEPEGGPVATEIGLTEGDPANLLRVEEGKPRVLPDPLFQKPTGFFEGSADFTLHLETAKDVAPGSRVLRVLVKYQSCNDRVCLPPHTDTVLVPLIVTK